MNKHPKKKKEANAKPIEVIQQEEAGGSNWERVGLKGCTMCWGGGGGLWGGLLGGAN